ncbi:MAG: fructosamine kinase family protein, partial [Spirochaetaceae bacterium]|nr:fructosamine kinase family protein [Spirochaetaceae bacterium]
MIEHAASLEDAIERLYDGRLGLRDRRSVGGGDINIASVLTLDDGSHLFLKENRDDLMPMFAAEAVGLTALADIADGSKAPPVPQ